MATYRRSVKRAQVLLEKRVLGRRDIGGVGLGVYFRCSDVVKDSETRGSKRGSCFADLLRDDVDPVVVDRLAGVKLRITKRQSVCSGK